MLFVAFSLLRSNEASTLMLCSAGTSTDEATYSYILFAWVGHVEVKTHNVARCPSHPVVILHHRHAVAGSRVKMRVSLVSFVCAREHHSSFSFILLFHQLTRSCLDTKWKLLLPSRGPHIVRSLVRMTRVCHVGCCTTNISFSHIFPRSSAPRSLSHSTRV